MNTVSIIEKKKFNQPLTNEEIEYIIDGYTNGNIPDYQIASLLMAIRLNGMSDDEIFYLTKAMINSGDVIELNDIEGFKIDKHSTGGVGDKVTLIVAPILASLGIPVAKFSGRGLGITGGTVDKLESIEGFNAELSPQEFIDNVNNHKIAVSGQSTNLCPADKKLYALRDVTGTVDSIPLIASSIMSKKIASGSDGIVLDVKYGNGAFMKTKDEAQVLAETMVKIGESFNKKIDYVLSDMNNPLGRFIGNKLEVKEAYELLSMVNPSNDLLDECILIASKMYQIATDEDFEASKLKVVEVLNNGKAKLKFEEWIQAQKGNVNDINNHNADYIVEVLSNQSGIVKSIDALLIGQVSLELGAGRLTKEDALDFDAGVELVAKHGENVSSGQIIARLFSNKPIPDSVINKTKEAFII